MTYQRARVYPFDALIFILTLYWVRQASQITFSHLRAALILDIFAADDLTKSGVNHSPWIN
jgi:hypothetical protein